MLKQKSIRFAPYLAMLAVFGVLFAMVPVPTGDDSMYASILDGYPLDAFLIQQYLTWSARTLVEAVICIVAHWPPLVWRIFTPIFLTICAWCIAGLADAHRSAAIAWTTAVLLFTLEWIMLSTAGWMCTTLCFVWPLCAGLLAVQPLARWHRGESVPLWSGILAVVGMLYAANMEQIMVVATLCLLGYAGYCIWKKRSCWLLWALLAACLLNAAYAAFSPGTQYRYETEITSSFMDYGMFTLLQKAQLGISAALDSVIFQPSWLFFALCVLLAIGTFSRPLPVWLRILSLFPAVVTGVLGVFGEAVYALFPKLTFFHHAVTKRGVFTVQSVWEPERLLAFGLLYAVLAGCVLLLYAVLGHTGRSFGAIVLLLAGFSSCAMLGFSPTVWRSGGRTAFFFLLSVLGCSLLVWKSLPGRRWKIASFAFLLLCAAVNLASVFLSL